MEFKKGDWVTLSPYSGTIRTGSTNIKVFLLVDDPEKDGWCRAMSETDNEYRINLIHYKLDTERHREERLKEIGI